MTIRDRKVENVLSPSRNAALEALALVGAFVRENPLAANPEGDKYMRAYDPFLRRKFYSTMSNLGDIRASDLVALAEDGSPELKEYALRIPSIARMLPSDVIDGYLVQILMHDTYNVYKVWVTTNEEFVRKLSDPYFDRLVRSCYGLCARQLLKNPAAQAERLLEGQRQFLVEASRRNGPVLIEDSEIEMRSLRRLD